MFRWVLVLLLVSLFSLQAQQAPPLRARTHQVKLNGQTFTLPVGFTIEQAAGPPLVDRPIVADFDDQGRLYVADSSGSNESVQVQLKKKPHRILRLEDTKGDGRFDRATVFADKMMFPEGVMWHAGSVYVAAPPSIWKLTDTDGDGVADQRTEWFQGKTLTGCANDLHGPYLGPDGWIYWCKGAFAPQTYERPGKKPLQTRAAHIFRARPDGTGVEPVMTGGMDNPVDLVFTPGGERIFTTTFLQFPGGGRRDGLIHAVYGGVYGKDWDVLANHPRTGPEVMPVLTHLGAAAPCGLTRYESGVFGLDYQDNLFACLFNMQKVTRHVLIPDGASFKSRDEDFLVSDNKDFHPTDVLEDADGSLLVIDTGGWYKLCCPTSQLYKPDVLGAIYRIRKKDAHRFQDPRGLKLLGEPGKNQKPEAGLTKLLDDPRPALRRRAIESLGAGGPMAVPWLERVLSDDGKTVMTRVNAVWAATRIDDPAARELVRSVLNDANETVCQAAAHSAGVWRDQKAVPQLLRLLESPSLPNRRVAAEALGRIGDKAAVRGLLDAAALKGDRFVEHSIIYALMEIADVEGTTRGLDGDHAATRRAAMIALDHMEAGKLAAKAVTTELASDDPKTKEIAWWIASRHPDWGPELAKFLQKRLADNKTSKPSDGDELARVLARLSKSETVQKLLADALTDAAASTEGRRVILKAIAQAGLKTSPPCWVAALTEQLGKEALLKETIAAAQSLRVKAADAVELAAPLRRIGASDKVPASVRLAALAAVPGGLSEVEPELFKFLRGQIHREQPLAQRSLAAAVLSQARLNAEQLTVLLEALPGTGPMEVDKLVDAFIRSKDPKLGLRLVEVLEKLPGKSALRAESLKPRLTKLGPEVQRRAEKLYAMLEAGLAEQKTKLDRLLPLLKQGDVRRGQAVFNSAKAACFNCHAIGYLGGDYGPDLTHIGRIRTERDLLEAIVFPNASFVRSYEPVQIVTRDGKVHNGVIRKDTVDALVLATGINQEVRLLRDDIEDIQPSRVSIMPAGLDQQLTPAELADLVAFLKACK
jgi:putative membrane-bound dehydrogenase-like protein